MGKDEKQFLLQMINEWIRFADAKAGAIFTINTAILGIILSGEPKGTACTLYSVFFYFGLVLIVIALYVAANILLPNLKSSSNNSRIYFLHISQFHDGSDYEKAISSPDYSFERDISNQIWANSKVAATKFENVYYATIVSLIGYAFIVVSYLITKL